jgi:hypothetical protein
MRRAPLLPLAAATYGLGCAVAVAMLVIGDPHPGQLPGGMLAHGFDARTPMRMMLIAMAAPFVAAFLLTPLLRRLDGARTWVGVAVGAALSSGLWIAVEDPARVVAVVFVPLVAAAALFLARDLDARFSRRDVILIPAALALFASLPKMPLALAVPLAAAGVMALRLIVAAMKPRVHPAYAFVLAPAALFFDVHFWFADSLRWLALALVVIPPVILAKTLRRPPRRLLVYGVYPLFALALMAAMSVASVDRAPLLDLFEDGHWLTNANELLHGAKPYADFIPSHGFINDALLEAAVMRLGGHDAGSILSVRTSLAFLLAPAVYFVALALTASAEAALLAILAAAAMLLSGTSWLGSVSVLESAPPIRSIPALFALACAIAAVRRRDVLRVILSRNGDEGSQDAERRGILRSFAALRMTAYAEVPRGFLAASALAVLALLTSLDYGTFALASLAVALLRFGPGRARALRATLLGGGAAALIAALAMAATGCLGAFVRVTLFEIPRLTEAYAMQFFWFPEAHAAVAGVPELLAGLFLPRVVWIVLWCLIALGTAAAAAATRPPHRLDTLLVAGAWVVVVAVAYGERAHVSFMTVAVPLVVAAICLLPRPHRAAAIVLMIVMCAPTRMLERFHTRLHHAAPLDPILARYDPAALPRTRGAWLDRRNAVRLADAQLFLTRALGPDDTFFDFANMPGLHWVFDRRAPVRYPEVPFYESEAAQREVIAAIDGNPHVRVALMQFTNHNDAWIDAVPNATRAPLVAAYLRARYAPAYARDGVVFWIRGF